MLQVHWSCQREVLAGLSVLWACEPYAQCQREVLAGLSVLWACEPYAQCQREVRAGLCVLWARESCDHQQHHHPQPRALLGKE